MSAPSALVEAGVDLVIVDTAHGHSRRVLDSVRRIKLLSNAVQVVAGNIATLEGAKALIDAGADSIKVGIGPARSAPPGSSPGWACRSSPPSWKPSRWRGRPARRSSPTGGIKYSGDLAKAIDGPGRLRLVGSLLAGTDETPGEVFLYQGRSYKAYRGMGSVAAMAGAPPIATSSRTSRTTSSWCPRASRARCRYQGPVANVLHQLAGGLRAAMGYVGAHDIAELHQKAEFVRISNAGLREKPCPRRHHHPGKPELSGPGVGCGFPPRLRGGWPSASEVGWGTAVRSVEGSKNPTLALPKNGEGKKTRPIVDYTTVGPACVDPDHSASGSSFQVALTFRAPVS